MKRQLQQHYSRVYSSVGRAPASHAWGRGFNSLWIHCFYMLQVHLFYILSTSNIKNNHLFNKSNGRMNSEYHQCKRIEHTMMVIPSRSIFFANFQDKRGFTQIWHTFPISKIFEDMFQAYTLLLLLLCINGSYSRANELQIDFKSWGNTSYTFNASNIIEESYKLIIKAPERLKQDTTSTTVFREVTAFVIYPPDVTNTDGMVRNIKSRFTKNSKIVMKWFNKTSPYLIWTIVPMTIVDGFYHIFMNYMYILLGINTCRSNTSTCWIFFKNII